MLTPFGIDSDGVTDSCHKDTREAIAFKALAYGLLWVASVQDLERLRAALETEPPAARDLWNEVLVRAAVSERGRPLNEVLQAHEAFDGWPATIRLALVGSDFCTRTGLISDDQLSATNGGLEFVRFPNALVSVVLRDLESLRQRPISADEAVADVWRERFQPLAVGTRVVTINDRYLAGRLLRDGGDADLAAFVRLAATDGVRSAHIFTEAKSSERGSVIAGLRGMRQRLPSLRRLDVTLCESAAFSSNSHARHVRFEDLGAVSLDKGLEGFSNPKFHQLSPCQWLSVRDARETEQRLTRDAISGHSLYEVWA